VNLAAVAVEAVEAGVAAIVVPVWRVLLTAAEVKTIPAVRAEWNLVDLLCSRQVLRSQHENCNLHI